MAHILLVDDDRDIRELGRALLTKIRHTVTVAESANQALKILRHQNSSSLPINLVLSDVNMPELSGFDMVLQMRKDANLKNLTVAFLTGRRERADIEQAVSLGVRDYIVKPLDPLLFLQKIKDLIIANQLQNDDAEAPALALVGASGVNDMAVPDGTAPTPPAPDFATTQLRWAARGTTEIEIISLSEVGLSIRTAFAYNHGAKIWLETDLFEKIGIDQPYMKVVASHATTAATFETRITFFGLNESSLSNIRAWVQKEVVKNAHSSR